MTKRLLAALGAGMAMVAVPAAGAQAGDDILTRAINTPAVAYSIYGPNQTSRPVKAAVPGGRALQVDVQAAGPDAWTVGASSPITKAIAKGDRIVVAFWARAPKLAGDATTPIPFVGVGGTAAPYQQIIGGPVAVGPTWTLHQVTGIAQADAPAGAAGVTLHLAAAKAVFEFGPVFVLDLGKAG